ncbi:biotin--[acetyl-CoA-carboxylase] ligase [Brachybacterium sp. FME24]|uniref:biotin--[acetyl-CoA-carboxylase] ligase n=1 Tax=Brachybacterium sp. FME24 TaxID=2742605 RepID=UPI0018667504|nr:biotin--[acetyl-CoA-carboxylase] ligase [Brachybacterium sp. FME24]
MDDTDAGVPAGMPSPRIIRLGTVTSTQDEAAQRLVAGEAVPFALTAREQRAGRGRLGRRFASPDGGNVYLTYVHRTGLDLERRTWFPLAAGLAAVDALSAVVGTDGVRLGLKWPNDLHTEDGRKLGGILVEGRGPDAVLIGIGLNVRGPVRDADGTEVPGAAWLLGDRGVRPGVGAPEIDEATRTDSTREQIEQALATALAAELGALESTDGDADTAGIARRYTMTCLTFGQDVRVDPLGAIGAGGAQARPLHGTARRVDVRGRLVVDLEEGDQVAVDVGDVRHVRPSGSARPTADAERGVEQEEHGT